MDKQYIKKTIKNNVGTIIIDRQETLNSMNEAVILQLTRAFTDFGDDQSVRVIILTGAGSKSFVSGGDIPMELSLRKQSAYEISMLGHKLMKKIETCPKPVIAAINGYCFGGGVEIIAACDIRISVDNAKFGMPSINVGTTCGFGGSYRVPKLIGLGNAKYLMMTGITINAQEAKGMGLIKASYPKESFDKKMLDLAYELSSKSMYTMEMTKKAIYVSNTIDYDKIAEQDAEIYSEVSESVDKIEGMTAFLEKRKPEYQDK